jgi:hypothetical protein
MRARFKIFVGPCVGAHVFPCPPRERRRVLEVRGAAFLEIAANGFYVV